MASKLASLLATATGSLSQVSEWGLPSVHLKAAKLVPSSWGMPSVHLKAAKLVPMLWGMPSVHLKAANLVPSS